MSTDSGSSKSTSYTSKQAKWLGEALDIYGPTLGQGTKVPSGTVGERLAPMTPAQTQATDVQGFLDRFAPYRDMPMFGETGTALSGVLSGTMGASPYTPQATEEYIKGAIADPRRKAFEKFEAPGIREEYAGPGYWGSSRPRAIAEARGEAEDWIGEAGAQTRWDVEQANRQIEEAKAGRALSGIGLGMDYARQPTQESLARLTGRAGAFELASAPQQQQQAEMNMARQLLTEEFAITDPEDMQIILNLLGMSYSTSKSQGPGLGYSVLSGLAGSMGSGIGQKYLGLPAS